VLGSDIHNTFIFGHTCVSKP